MKGEPLDARRFGSQTVDRATQLLRLVCTSRAAGLPLSEIVRMSGLTKPTVRRLLMALIRNGLLEQNADSRRYFAGLEIHALGVCARERYSILRLAEDLLVRIAANCGDAALLSVPQGLDTVCLGREEGTYPLRSHVLQPGHRHPQGCGSPGIALLSCESDAQIEAVLAANSARLAANYPRVTHKIIWQQIRNARKFGYALNEGLIFEGSWGIAVPVNDHTGRPCAALGIAGVEARFTRKRIAEMSEWLNAERLELERRLAQLGPR